MSNSNLNQDVKIPYIILYTKTGCPWGTQVINFLTGLNIPFEERNMLENDAYRIEAMEKSGQWKCPTLDINGHILSDSDVVQIETYLKSINVLN